MWDVSWVAYIRCDLCSVSSVSESHDASRCVTPHWSRAAHYCTSPARHRH